MVDFLLKKEQAANSFFALRRGMAWLLMYISLGLFAVVVLVYAVFFFINRSQTSSRESLLRDIGVRQDELRPELVNQIFTLESKLASIQKLAGGHIFTSNILKFLEENTLPNVRFLTFDFKSDTRRLEMAGDAANYAILTEQIILLERHPQVEKVEFGGLTLGANNLVNFRITIVFRPSLLLNPPFVEENNSL